jgi:hypothetical protein
MPLVEFIGGPVSGTTYQVVELPLYLRHYKPDTLHFHVGKGNLPDPLPPMKVLRYMRQRGRVDPSTLTKYYFVGEEEG